MDLPTVNFDCPHCGQPLSAPENLFGSTMPCPACQTPFEVPFAAWGHIPTVGESEAVAVRYFAELQKLILLSRSEAPDIRVRDLQSARWSPKELEQEVDPKTGRRQNGSGFKRGDMTMLVTPRLIISEMRARARQRHWDMLDASTGEDWKAASLLELSISMAEMTLAGWHAFIGDSQPVDLEIAPAKRLVLLWKEENTPNLKEWWNQAAKRIGYQGVAVGNEMVALCDSPIWSELSSFGRPFPPFNFHPEIGWATVFAHEADEMGILPEKGNIRSPLEIFQVNLSGGIKDGGWILEWERCNNV